MHFVIFWASIVLFAAWRLSSRYEYTKKARAILSWLSLGALLLSLLINLWRFPGLNLLYLLLAVVGLTMPIYAVMALAVVEYWRKQRQAVFDESIKALRGDEEEILEEITQSQQQIALADHKRQTLEEIHRDRLADQRRIRDFLDGWERGEGLARIRSIKVGEWREAFAAMGDEELTARRDELGDQLAKLEAEAPPDGPGGVEKDRIDQLRAQLSVATLVELGVFLDRPNAELNELGKKTDEAKLEKADAERRLESLRFELTEWERRRNEFLADRIVVGS